MQGEDIAVRGTSSGRWAAGFVDRPGPDGSSKWDRGGETDVVVVLAVVMVAVMTLTVTVRAAAEIERLVASSLTLPLVTSLGFGGSRHNAGQVASITSQYCTPIPSC